MVQYDVDPNPSHSAASGVPDVVVIQSKLLDALATRLTIPLAEFDVATKVQAKVLVAAIDAVLSGV